MKNHNHGLWMVLCCLAPLLLVFIAPVFGLRGGNFSSFLYFLALFACPLMMLMGHGGHDHENSDKEDSDHEGHEKKGEHHGCH